MNELVEIISKNEEQIRAEWMRDMGKTVQRADLISKTELEEQCRSILSAVIAGVRTSGPTDHLRGWVEHGARPAAGDLNVPRSPGIFAGRRGDLCPLAEATGLCGDTPRALGDQDKLFETIWTATELLDRLALITTEFFMATREELISRQQQELLELSTPVVKLWDGILALPIIGTLDSARTQVVMEELAADGGGDQFQVRDYRHHRRSDGGHAGRAASAQDHYGGATDGRRVHHQRRAAADRADHRPSGHQSRRRDHQGQAVRCICAGSAAQRQRCGSDSAAGEPTDPPQRCSRSGRTRWNVFRFSAWVRFC